MSSDILTKTVAFITYLDYICERKAVFSREIEKAILQCYILKGELSELDDNTVFIKALDRYEKRMTELLDGLNRE
ncbi:MAG: hypothetical protein KAS90_01845 [Candidatus Aenigmarchaeota archaeon]|nr:hypothetical protein [Candidatus Aenigmarchaeota archaeon]